MNPFHQPELFSTSPGDGATALPDEEVKPNTTLALCATEIERYTGLESAAAKFLVVAIVSLLLVGSRLLLGNRKLTYCIAWLLPDYASSALAALALVEKLVNLALAANDKQPFVVHTRAAIETLTQDRLTLNFGLNTVSIGTTGPFRGLTRKGTNELDCWCETMRGQHRAGMSLTQLWAGSGVTVAGALEDGKPAGFGALVGCIPCSSISTVPTALPDDLRSLAIGKLVGNVIQAVIDGKTDAVFSPSACGEVHEAAKGRQWADNMLQIAGIAAALHMINDASSGKIGTATVSHAVSLFQESERQKEALLALGDGSDDESEEDLSNLAQKADAIIAYALRKGCGEMSARDVVLHGLADSVSEAKLLLALLETRKLAIQELFILNNRPLQKWLLNGLRIPSTDEGGAQEKNGLLPQGDPLSKKGKGAQ